MQGAATRGRRAGLLYALAGLAILAAGCERFCAGPPSPDQMVPTLKGPDGRSYVLLARGAHKPFFDAQGSLERVEYDRNGDGKPDQLARHRGQRMPEVVENDDDFDGGPDRWLYYNPSGALVKIGSARRSGKRPDFWAYYDASGKAIRQEYDDDGDGKVDRAEVLKDGRVEAVEVDADRDGRTDRWQHWENGRLRQEELDTNGDGKPDRRLRYGPKGEVEGVDRIGG